MKIIINENILMKDYSSNFDIETFKEMSPREQLKYAKKKS